MCITKARQFLVEKHFVMVGIPFISNRKSFSYSLYNPPSKLNTQILVEITETHTLQDKLIFLQYLIPLSNCHNSTNKIGLYTNKKYMH